MSKARVAIIGASGYTGAELVRLLTTHPGMEIAALAADRNAGKTMGEIYPHLAHLDLPLVVTTEEIDWSGIDLVFCGLPHATAQEVIAHLPRNLKIVDLSADFRLRDAAEYARWYGHEHVAPDLQEEAVYGLPEFYREELKTCRLAAGTGCYVVCGLLPLVPLLEGGVIDPEEIVIDAKTGITGAGRSALQRKLFSEVTEGMDAYSIARHRHTAEFDQELSKAAGKPVIVSFTPHLAPMNRGILSTIYVKGDPEEIQRTLVAALRERALRACAGHGRRARDAACAGLQPLPDRGDGGPAAGAGDHRLGARQSGEGRLGAGGAVREPDARPAGDGGAGPRAHVPVILSRRL